MTIDNVKQLEKSNDILDASCSQKVVDFLSGMMPECMIENWDKVKYKRKSTHYVLQMAKYYGRKAHVYQKYLASGKKKRSSTERLNRMKKKLAMLEYDKYDSELLALVVPLSNQLLQELNPNEPMLPKVFERLKIDDNGKPIEVDIDSQSATQGTTSSDSADLTRASQPMQILSNSGSKSGKKRGREDKIDNERPDVSKHPKSSSTSAPTTSIGENFHFDDDINFYSI